VERNGSLRDRGHSGPLGDGVLGEGVVLPSGKSADACTTYERGVAE
jgi:hypothetical protein